MRKVQGANMQNEGIVNGLMRWEGRMEGDVKHNVQGEKGPEGKREDI